ncbi:hypothetical protein OIV83_005785 [Microbotryomycetes sp. JL201]|nr:hypothetical protein OIV83_005785 [Microbotryomycetes sp. JL201]
MSQTVDAAARDNGAVTTEHERAEARAPLATDTGSNAHETAHVDSIAFLPASPENVQGSAPSSTTIEQELSNVLSGLSGFWGKSANVYQQAEKQMETARKDLTPLMEKAKANLDSIGEQTRQEFARLSEQSTTTGVVIGPDGFPLLLDDSPARTPLPPLTTTTTAAAASDSSEKAVTSSDDKGKGVDRGERDEAFGAGPRNDAPALTSSTPASDAAKAAADQAAKASASAAAFFSRLQAQVASNPNVQGLSKNLSTLQHQVQHNLTALPLNLQTNLHQLQEQFAHIDLQESSKTAEAYLSKGEHWLQEFSQEVGRLAMETVKVVPPADEADLSHERTRKREERLRKAQEVAIGRRDLLVWKLRSDKDTLLVDPAEPVTTTASGADDKTTKAFSEFIESVKLKGGFAGLEWQSRIAQELEQGRDKLKATFDALVPAEMSDETFWSRYFFHVGQIDEDELRRKQILETDVNDDDFSWDMDDEDDSNAASLQAAQATSETVNDSIGSNPASLEPPLTTTTTTSGSTTGGGTTPQLNRNDSSSACSETDWGFSPDPREEVGFVQNSSTLASLATATTDTHVDTSQAATTKATTTESVKDCASPRASSDGTSSYDVVGERSGAPSERGDEQDREAKTAATKPTEAETDDSDWE